MAHKLIRFKEQILNKPHLIHENYLESIVDYIDTRNEKETYELAIEANRLSKAQGKAELNETDIALLSIDGTLTYESTFFQALCGGTSYQSLQAQFDKVVTNREISTIVLDVNSGGGEAYGMFELANYMRDKAKEHNKFLIAYVDGMSASAAYGLSSAADEIIVNPQSEVGSIGVVVRLQNSNKAQKEKGIETTYVHAGASKIPFNADGDFREEFINDIQSKIDVMYEDFTGMVANMRNVDQEVIKGTEANTFLPEKALELGLVDKVMTREEFFNYLADISKGESEMPLGNLFKTKKEVDMTVETQKPEADVSVVENEATNEVVETSAVVENETLLSELAELKAQLASKEQEAIELAATLEAENEIKLEAAKADMDSFVSTLKFVNEDTRSELSSVLFSLRESEGYELIKTSLEAGSAAIETYATKEIGVETEESAPASYEQTAKSAVSEKLKNKQ